MPFIIQGRSLSVRALCEQCDFFEIMRPAMCGQRFEIFCHTTSRGGQRELSITEGGWSLCILECSCQRSGGNNQMIKQSNGQQQNSSHGNFRSMISNTWQHAWIKTLELSENQYQRTTEGELVFRFQVKTPYFAANPGTLADLTKMWLATFYDKCV